MPDRRNEQFGVVVIAAAIIGPVGLHRCDDTSAKGDPSGTPPEHNPGAVG